jgi:hypothetical protein
LRLVVEFERRILAAQAEEVRQVLIGTFLPSGGPDELISLRKAYEAVATAVYQAVREPVDRIQTAGGRSVPWEPEDAQDPVNVHEKHWKL